VGSFFVQCAVRFVLIMSFLVKCYCEW